MTTIPNIPASAYSSAFVVDMTHCPAGVVLTISAAPCYSYAAACHSQAQAEDFLEAAKAHAAAAVAILEASHRQQGYVEDADAMQEVYVGALVAGLVLVAEQSGTTAFENGTMQ